MQTITTKYLPATSYRPSRVVAKASGGARLVQSVDQYEEGHIIVAAALKKKLGWTGRMVGGDTKTGKVFVFDDERSDVI